VVLTVRGYKLERSFVSCRFESVFCCWSAVVLFSGKIVSDISGLGWRVEHPLVH
jgi:hypothetical protein